MYNFFVKEQAGQDGCFRITGADYNHIRNVLRMQRGDRFLVSCGGISYPCCLDSLEENAVAARIIGDARQSTELPIRLYLFQGLPKGDKLELIIQKAVELGVAEIIPVEMLRCVVKLDEKKKKSRQMRWQSIAESAAKQSKRNMIPEVSDVLSYQQALSMAGALDLFLLPYENENGMSATQAALEKIRPGMSVGILIGPEGGFDPGEVELACREGAITISLGKRILRAETAAITAVGMCMLRAELDTDGAAQ